ncbi:hypothetical protein DL764_002009 [Monosporascus ibericus]|uniref:Uncharacterized protein n=1 Tax=Monosporascus ibericus TaxID=155417 RepID=A0A4Q4TM98_9PEZI|nr:hypothetical protein DL764_002009 [Monosporascus ibericus]
MPSPQDHYSTETVTTSASRASYEFLPGAPEPTKRIAERMRFKRTCARASSTVTEPFPSPTSSSKLPTSTTLSLPPITCTPPATTTTTVQEASTATTTVTEVVTSTETVYPCADHVDYQGPTYGDACTTADLGLENPLYYLSSPQGSSPRACCETCLFAVESRVQTYWFSYQGCAVSRATNAAAGTGHHVTGSCPVGTFEGLTYGPDVRPAFRSTGNIAGPCGQSYTYF